MAAVGHLAVPVQFVLHRLAVEDPGVPAAARIGQWLVAHPLTSHRSVFSGMVSG